MKVGVGEAHGKAILIGEHWVLAGAPAIALALPSWTTTVHWGGEGELRLGTTGALDPNAAAATLAMLREACRLLAGATATTTATGTTTAAGTTTATTNDDPIARGEVSIHSTVPMHRGFGSSAAFAVAALRALADRLGLAPDDATIWAAARAVENVVHGSSSGLDPAAAMADGNAVRFQGGQPRGAITPLATDAMRSARWLLLDVGAAPSTATAVARAKAARAAMPEPRHEALWHATAAAAAAAEDALLRGDPVALGAAMDAADAALRPLGVVDARLDEAIAVVRAAGALGAKQSGAGMGGVVLALAPNAAIADTMRTAAAPCAAATWMLEICR